MQKKLVPIFIFLVASLLLMISACKSKTDGDNSPEAVYTQSALTAEAILTKRAEDAGEEEPTSTPTPTEKVGTPTSTPRATATPRPETEQPINTATTAPGSCILAASFVKDVTIDDGTQLKPGEAFTKTWQLINAGTCTWDSGYTMFFLSGDQMSAPASVTLTKGITVAPDTLINVSVDLVAPVQPGDYRGDFKFKDASGTVFGINPNAAGSIYVKITVTTSTPTPTTAPTATLTTTVEATADPGTP